MERAQRREQSRIAIKERNERHNHNVSLAHGIFLHGLFRWFGEPKPNLSKRRTIFKWKPK